MEERVGTAIVYEDIGATVAKDGIKSLPPISRTLFELSVQSSSSSIPSKALHDLAPSVCDMRQMLHEMTGMLTAYQTTVFWVGEYSDDDGRHLPEFAVADGIIQLLRTN